MDKDKIYRLIDANLNRCREGLRVLEDVARFILDDEPTSRAFKEIRHSISTMLCSIEDKEFSNNLLKSRDTDKDVGKEITLSTEMIRVNVASIAKANFIRVEESLRVLEEFIKLFDIQIAGKIKSLRYSCYVIEKDFLNKVS